MTMWGGMGFSSTSSIKRKKANPIYWALFNIDNDQMTTGKYLIKYLIACCNQNICWNMRKNPPSPPLIDNDQTRLQWSSLQWRNWTLVQSGSNYLSLKLTTELSSTMVFFFADGGCWGWGGWNLEVWSCLRWRRPPLHHRDGGRVRHHQ